MEAGRRREGENRKVNETVGGKKESHGTQYTVRAEHANVPRDVATKVRLRVNAIIVTQVKAIIITHTIITHTILTHTMYHNHVES